MSNPVKYDGGMDFTVEKSTAEEIKTKMPSNWQMVQSAKDLHTSLSNPTIEGNLKKFIAATEKDPVKQEETLKGIKKNAADVVELSQIGSKESIAKAMECQQEINKGPVGQMLTKFDNLSPEQKSSAAAEPFKKMSNASATFADSSMETYAKTPAASAEGGKNGPPALSSMGAQKQAVDLALQAERKKVTEQKLGML